MAIETTDTAVLTRTINSLNEPSAFFLNRFFPDVQTEPGSEEIHFDIDKERPRLAPFVHPTKAGRVVEDEGYETKSFRPAYVKDKRRLLPRDVIKRSIGEPLTGALSPEARRELRIARVLLNQRRNLQRREEVMAAEALISGINTISGEDYPTVVVNYQRDAALTVALVGGALWSALATAVPLSDLEDWGLLIQDKSGAIARDVVMGTDSWKNFRLFPAVEKILDTRRGSMARAETGPLILGQGDEKARHVATIGDSDIWVYRETYVDDLGAVQEVMPKDGVLVASRSQVEGVRAYGTILDPKANFSSERFFAKSWMEEDPAVEWMLAQSAPLMVPYRPNATLFATVL